MRARPQAARRRRRHAAARSRVAVAILSVAAFLGIGAGLAARSSSGTASSTVTDPAQRSTVDANTGSNGISWSANPGGATSLPLSPITSTHAS
jgi:hypothetical protein